MSDDELVDIVDVDDVVVATVSRAEMRARGLRHRATYVVVRTTSGDVVVHRRAEWKDVHPGAWDLAFGGVVGAGEAWPEAAARELREEAGIDAPLRFLGEGRYDESPEDDATGRGVGTGINARIYTAVHDGPYPCPDGEVVEVRTVPVDALDAFLADHAHVPDSPRLVLPLLDQ